MREESRLHGKKNNTRAWYCCLWPSITMHDARHLQPLTYSMVQVDTEMDPRTANESDDSGDPARGAPGWNVHTPPRGPTGLTPAGAAAVSPRLCAARRAL